MRWGTVVLPSGAITAAFLREDGVVTVEQINKQYHTHYPSDLESIITQRLSLDVVAVGKDVAALPLETVRVAAPLAHPERIVGIGLNYRDHAQDLGENVPEEPATFIKPNNTIIGSEEAIRIPPVSTRTTAEAEIALVFGQTCRDVPLGSWRDVIFGVVPVLDMTTEDILRKNPRFLTRSKGYDAFFAFGPWIVTIDELGDWTSIVIETVVNGVVKARSDLAHMTYGLDRLVAFITTAATVGATAVLSTGTPGAAVIHAGDVVEARVTSIGTLVNPVIGS
ncbi:MAG: fumarylacetoacetate hydrolase family protein [Sulfobacillus thermotolerans]|nr:fumarylacetoacetate hydrolase family protein [Sulfobacillus thermotolerans]